MTINLLHGKLGSYGSHRSAPQEDPRTSQLQVVMMQVVWCLHNRWTTCPSWSQREQCELLTISQLLSNHDSNSVMVLMFKDSHMFLMSKDWAWVPNLILPTFFEFFKRFIYQ